MLNQSLKVIYGGVYNPLEFEIRPDYLPLPPKGLGFHEKPCARNSLNILDIFKK